MDDNDSISSYDKHDDHIITVVK